MNDFSDSGSEVAGKTASVCAKAGAPLTQAVRDAVAEAWNSKKTGSIQEAINNQANSIRTLDDVPPWTPGGSLHPSAVAPVCHEISRLAGKAGKER